MNAHSDLLQLAWTQCWQVAALVVAVGLATWLGCRRRPHLAYVLWMLVVLKCLTPPLWSSPTGVFTWVQGRPVVVERPVAVVAPVAEMPSPAVAPAGGRVGLGMVAPVRQPGEIRAVSPVAAEPLEPVEPVVRDGWSISAAETMVAGWLAGAGLLAGLVVLQVVRCRRRVKSQPAAAPAWLEVLVEEMSGELGLRRRVRLAVTAAPIGPATAGLLRPVVILPQAVLAGRDAEGVRPILAHELIHVRRRDVLFGLLQSAAQLVLWFHPLVWWANRQASREVERCCDEEVVAGLGCQPATYARCLVDVLEAAAQPGRAAGVSGDSIQGGDPTTTGGHHAVRGGSSTGGRRCGAGRSWLRRCCWCCRGRETADKETRRQGDKGQRQGMGDRLQGTASGGRVQGSGFRVQGQQTRRGGDREGRRAVRGGLRWRRIRWGRR